MAMTSKNVTSISIIMAARAIGNFQWSLELHRKLIGDSYRNDCINRALRKVVRKGITVSDVGSGTGFVGFLAAKMGAKSVHMYEADKEVSKLSQELAKSNFIQNCEFVARHTSTVHNPVKTDVVVSETLGTYVLEENLLETIEDAKRFLKPDGVLMPQRVRQFIAPVSSSRLYKLLDSWESVRKDVQLLLFALQADVIPGTYGLNFQIAKRRSLSNLFQLPVSPEDLFEPETSPQVWDTINLLQRNQFVRSAKNVTWRVKGPQAFYGFCIWWETELVPGVVLSTSPFGTATHWQQAYAPLVTPLHGKRGDLLLVDLSSRSDPERGGCIVTWDARILSQGKVTRAEPLESAPKQKEREVAPPKSKGTPKRSGSPPKQRRPT